MSLSDIMGAAGLASYAEIALLLFLFAFFAVLVRVMYKKSSAYEGARHLPLEESGPDADDSGRNSRVRI